MDEVEQDRQDPGEGGEQEEGCGEAHGRFRFSR